MKPSAFASSMRRVVTLFGSLDLLQDVRTPHSLTPSAEFKRAALTRPRYPDLYLVGLRGRDYNVLLTDFSFLQFSRVGDSADVSLRYAYYPNPFRSVTFEAFLESVNRSEDTDAFEDYAQFLQGQPFENAVPVVRYDLAGRDYREFVHPTAHLHFGLHSENRWPVSIALTPHAFALHIAKMFYVASWQASPIAEDISDLDRTFCNEKRACGQLSVAQFSARERDQLHFG